ncbi:MAG: SIS domain-containing protein [Armatimonadota bacterium]|nr:SIS domain-containing protein [bacterium]MDW8319748.1 SIS domain-containing protein [Armatimonadota bacterium]
MAEQHYMHREIHEQPLVVRAVAEKGLRAAQVLAQAIRERGIQFVMISARGTSDNAALYAKYRLEIEAGIPVGSAAPSIFTLYDGQLNLSRALVIGISQSGKAQDVVEVVSSARASGALTAAITNDPSSELAQVAEHVLLCHAGEERSVAATKTYIATLANIALLIDTLTAKGRYGEDLEEAARGMEQVLQMEEQIELLAERYRYMSACMVLSRGYNFCTAHEAALKMMETGYVIARAYSAADFLHGPIAVVDTGFPCFVYAPNGNAYATMLQLTARLRERGAEIVVVSCNPEILRLATRVVVLPCDIAERISPLVYIVVGQLFAFHLSETRGYDPDRPRGLSKITITR